MLARPLVHNAPFPAAYSVLHVDGSFDSPTFVGAAYNDSVIIAGGSGTYTNCRVVLGEVPAGLLPGIDGETILLTGDVTSPSGTYYFVIAVDDPSNGWTAFIEGSIVVYAALSITGTFTGTGNVGVPYNSSITISGGDGDYSNQRVFSGASPDGLALSIDGDQLILSGTPTVSDSFDFTVQCDSGDGQTAFSDPQSIFIVP